MAAEHEHNLAMTGHSAIEPAAAGTPHAIASVAQTSSTARLRVPSTDILRGRLRENADITEMTGSAVDLHFPKIDRAVNCVIDGELLPMGKDVALRLHAGELKVIVPRVEAQVAAPTTEAAA